MPMQIVLHDDDRVDALHDGQRITTQQDGSGPAPFQLFLASIGTCTGLYVARFCRQRGLPAKDVCIEMRFVHGAERGRVERIEIEIALPEGFPERYRAAVARAAGLCAVKKHLEHPPVVEIRTTAGTPAGV